MWRINGVKYYQFMAAFLLIIEVGVILGFVSLLVLFNLNRVAYSLVQLFLTTSVVIYVMVTLNLVAYVIIFQFFSQRSDARHDKDYHKWLRIWSRANFTNELPDEIPNTLAIRQSFIDFVNSHTFDAKFLKWAAQYQFLSYWRAQLSKHNKENLIDAIASLGLLGDKRDLKALQDFTQSHDLDIAIVSVTAQAQLITRLDDESVSGAIAYLAHTLIQQNLPTFVIEDVYYLLGARNLLLKSYVLSRDTINDNLLLATIHSIAANYESQFANNVGAYFTRSESDVRVAILRLFVRLKYIPENFFKTVLSATRDDNEDVRQQAVKTIQSAPFYRIRLPLWLALGDDEWAVRYSSASVLYDYGKVGQVVLTTASQKHASELGKQMATMILEMNQH